MAFPITLAIGFYNSLYYRNSRDKTRSTKQLIDMPTCVKYIQYYNLPSLLTL